MKAAVLRAVKVDSQIRVYKCFGIPYAYRTRDQIIEGGKLLAVGALRKNKINWTGYGLAANEENISTWNKLQVIL